MNNTLQDRIRGSLIGGAIGDALGYPVEFIYTFKGIQSHYGERGITRLDTRQHWLKDEEQVGKAVVSDDTQMTMFTACGILNAGGNTKHIIPCITKAYTEWYYTQRNAADNVKNQHECWISNIPSINVRRAPGNTCMNSLHSIVSGKNPMNNSKGCGGIMRIAPIPLYGVVDGRIADIGVVDRLAAEASEITHQHPLGFIPSAFTAHVIYRLAQDEHPDKHKCKEYVEEALDKMNDIYSIYAEHLEFFTGLIRTAVSCSETQSNDVETIEQKLGGGWVAEETAAIAIYCVLKYFDNFEEAMIASVNHAGDSDSTGAVTGNILGAAIGYDAIPVHYKKDVEFHDEILHLADDLYRGKSTTFQRECESTDENKNIFNI